MTDTVPLGERTTYIPRMCDHADVIAAALRHHALACEVLPPTDRESLDIGLDLCRGRECLPCFLTTGDLLRRCRRPDFDPTRSAFLMPSGPGPCRFGQYGVLQRQLLDDAGFRNVELLAPSSTNSYRGFGERPLALRKLAWEGIVAVDLLQKLLHELRPYETAAGSTDRVYAAALGRVTAAIEDGGGAALMHALRATAGELERLEVNRSERRPVVAFVGEIYVTLNDYSNRDLIRMLERAGAEVLSGTFADWLHFSDWCLKDNALRFGEYRRFVGAWLTDAHQRRVERRLRAAVGHLLRQPAESPTAEVMDLLRHYWDPSLGSESTLTMGKVLEMARAGVSGVVNVLPFACMPGLVVAGMAPRLRHDLQDLPWLDLMFDGQEETNVHTRLEAFMHQVAQFRDWTRRRGASGAGRASHPDETAHQRTTRS